MTELNTDAILWRDATGGREHSHFLIVMHGYGSNEADLFQLAPLLPENLTVAALRAPIDLASQHPLMSGSYSWFPLAQENPDPSLIKHPVASVLNWLDALPHSFASIGLLGFSQGGAMAVELARTAPDRFDYLVQLSGFVAPHEHAGDARLKARTPRLPAFQSWGTFDDVIGRERTDTAIAWMAEHLDTDERAYPRAHSIAQDELSDIVGFLTRVTGELA